MGRSVMPTLRWSRWSIAGMALGLLWTLNAAAQAQGSATDAAQPCNPEIAATQTAATPTPTAAEAPLRWFASPEDGFGAETGDGRYALRVGSLLSFRDGLLLPKSGPAQPFADVRLVRLALSGHIWQRWLTYFVQAELAGTQGPRLIDAEARLAPHPALQLRIGQFRTPVSRAFITGIGALGLTERSFVSDYFRAGRDTGLLLQGTPLAGRLEYYLGVFNGNGINAGGNENPQLMYLGRLVWAPLGALAYDETVVGRQGSAPGRIALGVNAYHDRLGRTHSQLDPNSGLLVQQPDPDLVRSVLGADLAAQAGPVWGTVEGFTDIRDTVGAERYFGVGGFAQLAVALAAGVEAVGRFSFIAPDTKSAKLKGMQSYEAGVNWYWLANNAKLQLRYAYTRVTAVVAGLLPKVPIGHGLALQLQLQV